MKSLLTLILIFCGAGVMWSQDLYVVSMRKDIFHPVEVVSKNSWTIAYFEEYEVDPSNVQVLQPQQNFKTKSTAQLLEATRGKDVLFVIHGMAKAWGTANKDIFNMYWSANEHLSDYDIVVALSWPGGNNLGISTYFKANKTSKRVGKRIVPLVNDIEKGAQKLDFITHSMGSKVLASAIKKGSFEADNIILLAPSILRNQFRPVKRWNSMLDNTSGKVITAYSRNDFAFSWTSLQHVGMGYNGMKIRRPGRFPNLVQVDCSAVINQDAYRAIPRHIFKSRSNHSMYCESQPVFNAIASCLRSDELRHNATVQADGQCDCDDGK